MFERDYFMREVKKLSALLAKITRLRAQSEHAMVIKEVRGAYERAGLSKSVLDFVDPQTLISMVGSVEATEVLGQLMEQEAGALVERGAPEAGFKTARAQAILRACAAQRGGTID